MMENHSPGYGNGSQDDLYCGYGNCQDCQDGQDGQEIPGFIRIASFPCIVAMEIVRIWSGSLRIYQDCLLGYGNDEKS